MTAANRIWPPPEGSSFIASHGSVLCQATRLAGGRVHYAIVDAGPPLDPEPWLDPVTRGDTREVRWANVDRVGEYFYRFEPREGYEQDRAAYPELED